jgi:hypothetical protein
LLIVGLGRIGEAISVRARPFGVRVVAVKHDPSTRHDAGVAVDEVLGMAALDEALARADHVCVTVPLTPATHHLIDARRIARLRAGAFVYNIARRSTRPAGRQYAPASWPAPASTCSRRAAAVSRWDLDNVILTPHAGVTPLLPAAPPFADNLGRFLAGRPRFDPPAGTTAARLRAVADRRPSQMIVGPVAVISHDVPAKERAAWRARRGSRRASQAGRTRRTTATSPAGVSVGATSPSRSNARMTSAPKSTSIGASRLAGWW